MPVDVFADVPESELRRAGRRRTFARGEIVFHEGDPGDSLHRVARGRFAARITTPRGRMHGVFFCITEDAHWFEAPIAPFELTVAQALH